MSQGMPVNRPRIEATHPAQVREAATNRPNSPGDEGRGGAPIHYRQRVRDTGGDGARR